MFETAVDTYFEPRAIDTALVTVLGMGPGRS